MRRGDVHKSRDWKTPPTCTSSPKNLAYGIGVLNNKFRVGNWCLNSGQRGPILDSVQIDPCQESTTPSNSQPESRLLMVVSPPVMLELLAAANRGLQAECTKLYFSKIVKISCV